MTPQIQSAADRLQDAIDTGRPCAPVRDLIGEHDIDAAYAVQEILAATRLDAGNKIVGRKIGLTSDSVRSQLGVSRPDFGSLFSDMSYATGEPVPLERLLQPRVEAEIAFVLKQDIDNPHASVTDVLRATDFVVAAIEIVDSRVDNWDIRIADTVADNASSGLYTLGCAPFSLNGLDLAQVGMVLEHEGEPVSVGSGAACMANPVVAVAWLAREVARRGTPLKAGEVVLSGALGPMVPVKAAGVYTARLDGLGEVQTVFTDDGGAR
ncbi:2-keto-4-pentenoate hydratase [Kutzneria sp. 744]|uniref:2-keto-4-pentenoate hydratase n=1 Tax=Kutzneria sp. (strain 744) TaxID=345341 RepID=UPI0005C24409|nr:fumarylacetoacetate hydrolase family protein [Kutzneria sp. 744]